MRCYPTVLTTSDHLQWWKKVKKSMKLRTFEMFEDIEEEESSNISSIGRDTQPPMICGLTMMTLMLQNSSKSSIRPPLQVNKRYKYTPNSPSKSLSSKVSKHSKNYYTYTFYTSTLLSTPITMYATTTQGPCLIPLTPTPIPSPMQIPLPPSNTHTTASTQWGTPNYMPRTPSP